MASAAAAAGDFTWAARLASVVSLPAERTRVLADLAEQATRAQDYALAEEFAREITDSFSAGRVLYALADAIAGSDPARAAELASSARAVARTIGPPHARAHVLARVAETLHTVGQPEAAATLLDTVEIIVNRLDDPVARAWGLADLARALAHVGRKAGAAAAQSAAQDAVGGQRVHALNGAALAWAAAGDAGHAIDLVHRAESLESSISDREELNRARAAMARAAASAGDFDLALLLGRRVESVEKTQSFARLAAIAADAGEHGHAEAFVREIEYPVRQAREFTALADAALRDGASARARRLAACALAAGTWTIPLAVLARVDPAAVTALAAWADETGKPPSASAPAASPGRE
jgi:tetratricopeptide (TPR) repeat protein